ncbi:MAG: magnesium transporter CorA family protein [Patescibacteria group bacterium]|nr:magnesium transporter CorA family protein [Patescibacteria group bacterium]MDD4304751.1 magnesium transporter CorA family protein [Patescibacteria group bacterium]MDD4695762.1 magnesium transporter CorA family protein [Patescibacteria group bacterium]
MFNIYFRTIKGKEFRKINELRDGAWINIENATEEDLKKVAEITNLDYIDLEDSLDPYELSRIERQDNNIIIFVRNPLSKGLEEEFLHTQTLTIILTEKYFITISISKNSIIESLITKDCLNIELGTTQRGKLLFYILLRISKSFTRQIKKTKNNVLAQKKHIAKIENSDIIKLIENEEILNQYLSALSPMRAVFKDIATGKYIQLYEYDQDIFEDVVISIKQSAELCEMSIKSIQSLRDSYQIIFTNRLNKVIKFLTSFTIIMTVPTIVASVYGMNINLPLSHEPLAFWYVMIIIFGLSIILTYIFARRKWL